MSFAAEKASWQSACNLPTMHSLDEFFSTLFTLSTVHAISISFYLSPLSILRALPIS